MRVVLRLITALLGLAVAAAGLLLVIEVIGALLRPDMGGIIVSWRALQSTLDGVSWRNAPVRIVAAATALVGLILLFAAMRAGLKEIRLHDPAPEVTVTTDPRSLARLVGHQVRAQDGVSTASVTAKRTRVRVKAVGRFRQLGDLPAHVRKTVDDSIGDLPISKRPKVSVSVSPPKERT